MFSSAESSFMSLAMDQAKAAYQNNEVPVGAIIVKDNKVIGKGRNRVIENQNVSSHAEIEAIIDASKKIKNYRLNRSTMYVTLEPCQMCAGALFWSQISQVVYGARDQKRGYLAMGTKLHPKTTVTSGILADQCAALIHDFFDNKRG